MQDYVRRMRAVIGTQLMLIPGARIVIEDRQGRILLQRRSDFGVWGIPGGCAEPGETIDKVIKREVFEETGLRLTEITPFGHASDPRFERITFPNGDIAHFHAMNFCSKDFSGTLARDKESLELAWFAVTDLPQMLPNMRRSISEYGKFKQDGRFRIF